MKKKFVIKIPRNSVLRLNIGGVSKLLVGRKIIINGGLFEEITKGGKKNETFHKKKTKGKGSK